MAPVRARIGRIWFEPLQAVLSIFWYCIAIPEASNAQIFQEICAAFEWDEETARQWFRNWIDSLDKCTEPAFEVAVDEVYKLIGFLMALDDNVKTVVVDHLVDATSELISTCISALWQACATALASQTSSVIPFSMTMTLEAINRIISTVTQYTLSAALSVLSTTANKCLQVLRPLIASLHTAFGNTILYTSLCETRDAIIHRIAVGAEADAKAPAWKLIDSRKEEVDLHGVDLSIMERFEQQSVPIEGDFLRVCNPTDLTSLLQKQLKLFVRTSLWPELKDILDWLASTRVRQVIPNLRIQSEEDILGEQRQVYEQAHGRSSERRDEREEGQDEKKDGKMSQLFASRGSKFSTFSEEDRGNFEIAKNACWLDDGQFQYVTEDLQNDKRFLLAVIAQKPLVLRFANEILRDDLTVVLAAVGGSQAVKQHVSAKEQQLLPFEWDFEGNPRAKNYASPRLQENEIVSGYAFGYASASHDASSNHRAAPAGIGADSKTCSESASGIELSEHRSPLSAGGFANRVGHDAPSPGSGGGVPQDASSCEQRGMPFSASKFSSKSCEKGEPSISMSATRRRASAAAAEPDAASESKKDENPPRTSP